MAKEKFFMNENTAAPPPWISTNFGMEMNSDRIPNCFFNPNWENSMDQSDPFESALSSIVSSPVASNANTMLGNGGGGDGVMMTELIGRLGSICNSGEISPQSYIGPSKNNTSTHNSCYSTPLNSPPKLNLMETQIMGNFSIPANHLDLPSHPNLSPISADPGFVERAARFSCFGGRNLFGLNETELPYRLNPRTESDKLSRVSSNQSLKVAGSSMTVPESKKSSTQMGNPGSDKKFSSEKAELGDSREGSSVSEQILGGDLSMKGQNDSNARKRKSIPRGKAKESPASDAKVESENNESNTKKRKTDEAADATNGSAKSAGDGNQMQNKDNSKPPEPPKDYIHVRARRGQATDSHSLAERVRRDKISQRMKFLQDLVPGCNKVTGKAVMLDEIINYVQSLQRQVEFLSMKLATVNPRIDSNMEALLSKDIFQSRGPSPHTLYQLDSTMSAFPYGLVPQQAPPLHNSMSNGAETQFSVNPLNAALRRNPIDGFVEAAPQVSAFWEDGLESVVQMGAFGQNQQQGFHGGSIAAAQMKVEL